MNFNDVPSPCISICKIDEPTQRCLGCERTIDEITRWSRMDNDSKQAVMDDLVNRRLKVANPADKQVDQRPSELTSQQTSRPSSPQASQQASQQDEQQND